jgi:linoleoyl-CoA desaturase
MAITDIKAYAHLTEADVAELERELDAIRADIEESRGERDARYIRRAIRLQRTLAVGGRIALFNSRNKVFWAAGTGLLAAANVVPPRSWRVSYAACGLVLDSLIS